MREKGILTFRDILNGVAPAGLTGVFAFASLSYAMSVLLLELGRRQEGAHSSRARRVEGLDSRSGKAGGFFMAGADTVARGRDTVAATAQRADGGYLAGRTAAFPSPRG